ncbi:MAG: NADH-quinone oxidoreductase subunit H [Sandaracinaceae bacterium]|nr:NADH-quinone oxidoreductase subunit H [Sandaracinaceae bacterium]
MDSFLLLSTAAKIGFALAIIFSFAPVLIWAERRQSAMMQDRVGPVRANIKLFGINITLFGLLHPLADALKLIFKEDFVPPKADKFLHALAPIISLVPAISVFAVIPFGDVFYPELWNQHFSMDLVGPATRGTPLQIASLNVGILFIFGIAGTGVVGAAIAGYSSNNKYSLLGGIRAAGQMVSYEVTLGMSLVGCFMVYDSLLLEDMVHWQMAHMWGVMAQPIAFFVFFTAAIAETKRIPFDVPEGESEIVGGYFTEYSGMKFGMFFMGEFVEVVTSSAILITLFFGGYHMPFLNAGGWDFSFQAFGHVYLENAQIALQHWGVTLIEVVTWVLKLSLMIWFQLMIRWSLPRFRYDQIMALCWKVLLPLSLLNILITGLVIIWNNS